MDRLAILNAAHPRKLSQGLHHPGQLRKSWYFFFFDLPDLPEAVVHADRWRFFRHFLRDAHPACTPEEIDRYVEAWSQPGAATGMINYYRSSVRTSPKKAEAALRPIKAPALVIWGQQDRYLGPDSPSPTTTTCRTSTASSGCPTPRTGCTMTRPSASPNCSPTFSPPPGQPGTDQGLRRAPCAEVSFMTSAPGVGPGQAGAAELVPGEVVGEHLADGRHVPAQAARGPR